MGVRGWVEGGRALVLVLVAGACLGLLGGGGGEGDLGGQA